MIKELRNDFVSSIFTTAASKHLFHELGHMSAQRDMWQGKPLPLFVNDTAIRGNVGNSNTFFACCGPCYGELDTRYNTWDDYSTAFIYCAHNRVVNDYNSPYNPETIENRKHYILYNFFDPRSPWFEIVNTCFPEVFENYNTPEEKAEFVAEYGWFIGPTAFRRLTKIQLGAFMVYTRRQNEFMYVRETFKELVENELTKDLPLAWNMFFAHHHMMNPRNKKFYSSSTTNSHNCFYPDLYPLTALAFTVANVAPLEEGSKLSWEATNGNGTWQNHNSDGMWDKILKDIPKYAKVRYIKPTDRVETFHFKLDVEGNAFFEQNIAEISLDLFNKKVLPYLDLFNKKVLPHVAA